MADSRLEKQYAKLLASREKNVAKNLSEGRTMNMSGVPLNETHAPVETLGDVLSSLKQKGKVQNLADTVKTTPNDLIGINSDIAYKSRFANLDKKLSPSAGTIGEELQNVGKVVNEDIPKRDYGLTSMFKNNKGFSKVLPMLGMGATALGALGIANKVQAGELGQAGLDTADLATDYVPVLSQAKMAIRPSELGNAELPPEEMQARNAYNAQMRMNKEGQPVQYPATEQPQLAPEDRAKYEDMKKQFSSLTSRMK